MRGNLVEAKAQLKVALTTSASRISLSSDKRSEPLQLIISIRVVSSSNELSAVTLCTDGSVLHNGQHERPDGLFWGAIFPLESTTHPGRFIPLAFLGSPREALDKLRDCSSSWTGRTGDQARFVFGEIVPGLPAIEGG